MTPLAPAAPPAPESLDNGPDLLAARLRETNPFAVNRVDRLAPPRADVADIHRGPYEKVLSLAQQACADHHGIGAVLWGDAGAGKSHLLARLARWARQDNRASFVYLHNLLPNPAELPRYVLKSVISYLSEGMSNRLDTPLFRLVHDVVRDAVQHDQVAPVTWPSASRAYLRLAQRLAAEDPTGVVLFDRDIYQVLFHFFRSLHPAGAKSAAGLHRLALRWLSGDALDPEEAKLLSLRTIGAADEGVRLADDQQIKQVLVALTQLALSRRQPFLLCFDQVDNLGQERVAALAQFLHALLDNAANLLVVFCGTQQTLRDYQQAHVIHEAAWHRLAQYRIELLPIGRDEARHILEARLASVVEPVAHLPEVKQRLSEDSLFPLGRGWFDDRVAKAIGLQPRRVIDWARERWERQQARLAAEPAADWLATWDRVEASGPRPSREALVDRLVAEKIQELRRRRQQEPHGLPSSAEHLAGLVRTLLEQCLERPEQYDVAGLDTPEPLKQSPNPPYHFAVRRPARAGGANTGIGVLFVGTDSALSATASLRRFLKGTAVGKLGRVLLVTEERQPLRVGSKGQEYLDRLRGRPAPAFAQVVLTFAQYAELDALQEVVGLARAGDLDVDGTPVGEDEVIASHHRCGRYRAQPLLRELLAGDVPRPAPAEAAPVIDQQDLREFIASRLALTSGRTCNELAADYRNYRAKKGQSVSAEACRGAIESLAIELHAQGQIEATSGDGGLMLVWK